MILGFILGYIKEKGKIGAANGQDMLCYVYFSSGGPSAPKVPYWGTGRAGLEKSESIYTLITEMLLDIKV